MGVTQTKEMVDRMVSSVNEGARLAAILANWTTKMLQQKKGRSSYSSRPVVFLLLFIVCTPTESFQYSVFCFSELDYVV